MAEQPAATADDSAALLELIRQLVTEMHPRRARRLRVTLASTLDRDLGFDSLSRVELLMRLQRQYGIVLPDDLFASAETPRDLLQALNSAGEARHTVDRVSSRQAAPEAMDGTPDDAETLPEVLAFHVERAPKRTHVYLYGDGAAPEIVDYASLAEGARAIAAGLQAHGVAPGQSVAIMLPTSLEYLHTFFGVLMAGAVPVPIYPPARPSQLEDHLRRHAGILDNAAAVLLITVGSAKNVGRLLKAHVYGLREVLTPNDLLGAHLYTAPAISSQDVAFLQYTSGSTGQPKGVILTHANLLGNIRAMGEAVAADSTDVFVSWLPLYHDMGLIGAWLASLYFGMQVVLMSPLKFLTYPPRWLWAVHEHRATFTAAPNFAYELCLAKIEDRELDGLDLSSLRMAFNGAEPISANTVRAFSERFARYGFRSEALTPVYGLAESAVGLAFPPLNRGPIIDRVDRRTFESSGKAVSAEVSDAHALEFVACGQPLPGYQIRIVDGSGRELPDRQEGRLEFQGPSATSGYMRNVEATERLFDGAWLDSGDLGYVHRGDVYLTRRVKDIIIRGGRNIYPYEVEEAIGEIAAIRRGCVAVFGSSDGDTGTERVVIVAETRETGSVELETLESEVVAVATDVLDMPPDVVVLAPPHSVLKTSSGKIRRAAVRDLFESGHLGQRVRAVWWQIARVAVSSVWASIQRAWRRVLTHAYGAYFVVLLAFVGVPVWVLVAVLPGGRPGYAVGRRGAKLLFRLAGIPVRCENLQHLPNEGPVMVVVNHASYVDGAVLMAALPRRLVFAAKGELAQNFFTRRFLAGIGAVFVERFDVEGSVQDTERIIKATQTDDALAFFPEGTFTRSAGLLPFHMGAFVIAARTGTPVTPVAMSGTRSVLRDGAWPPRRAAIDVSVGEPIEPLGADWSAAVALRDAAREQILQRLGEPDLALSASPVMDLNPNAQ